ncbi:DoxX family membrane protein [Singulisphaera sp. Ch08]|uniref:DoxX family membrane protein n=1 Tax=Singulisphaera sp. Ch08 TaxID=3120278 RepID=A0AAU7CA38_9BACT
MPALTTDSLSSIYIPLRLIYGLVPIVAGLDKFFNLLTQWDKYLPTSVAGVLPISPHTFMLVVGVIEIVAGLAVLTKFTRLGAYVVMAWLVLIALNLILVGDLDIAVRDLVMAAGAYTLGQVAAFRKERWVPVALSSN